MAFLYKEKSKVRPSEKLRELLKSKDVIPVIGVFNPISALLVESMGFEAAYLSGAALTGSYAMPDLGLITLSELAESTRYITRVVNIPLIVDADTGFGEVINVQRTVKELVDANAAAVQIEDQVLPKKCGHLKGKKLIPPEEMAKKIVAAKKIGGEDILIIARTDARGVEGLDSAIERARIYVKAGADIIFPEALTSEEEFKEFAHKISVPLLANMTEFGKTPYYTIDQFKEWGYKLVIFPVTLLRISLGAMREALKVIREKGTQRGILGKMMTRHEFYDLIGYSKYEEQDSYIDRVTQELLGR
ncbi:MAG: methylisocitrate lyase [Desulfurococcales archaeon]|nr:methylisocitrate lyase [Desulfurococcales archaeon]